MKTLKTLLCGLAAFALLSPAFADDAAKPADAGTTATTGGGETGAAPSMEAPAEEKAPAKKAHKKHAKKHMKKKKTTETTETTEPAPAQ